MIYKDKNIAYRKGDNVYAGVIKEESDKKTLIGFLPFYLIAGKELEEKHLYIIMLNDSYRIFELEKIRIDHIDELDEDELIDTCNNVLNKFINKKYH